MNLEAIHRLIEEAHDFQMQQASAKARCCDVEASASPPKNPGGSCFPLSELQPHAAPTHGGPSQASPKWDICEELRLRELEEVKARAAQMEKTMRWWSDCTANWREKWSKVRVERNLAKEEGRQLRLKLDMVMKELSVLKKKQSLSLPREATGTKVNQDAAGFVELSSDYREPSPRSSQLCGSMRQCLEKRQFPAERNTDRKEAVVNDPLRLNEETNPDPDCSGRFRRAPGLTLPAKYPPPETKGTDVSALPGHLAAFQHAFQKEREMRVALEKEIERLESALSLWKRRYEDLKTSKAPHGKELERLQADTTLEWDKREILESEKQRLERENRKLKIQVEEMKELLERKNRLSTDTQGPATKISQMDLQGQPKELYN
ncbi:coiled-coil domain-containing protein 102B isoform X2 [Dipodomys merriami]|uniref:coiled-coil domain-containing protein 102B isoform X2 n=1 Tax=Dipodomys merriami TaxID=94247 RepID=UPI0038557A58